MLDVPSLGSYHKTCSKESLVSNICFHTWDPLFYSTKAGICFLQYSFQRKLDYKLFWVLNFHHNFSYRSWETSNIDLKSSPASSFGRHTLLHANQCLLLPDFVLLHKNLVKILRSSFMTHIGGTMVDETLIGILCKTLDIGIALPLWKSNLPLQEYSFPFTFSINSA